MGEVTRPTLFLLHGLGLSGRFWDRQIAALGAEFDCVALDVPGFGEAHDATALSVEEMVDWLIGIVRARSPDAWMFVGHSMGGKLATLATARIEAGEPGLAGLAGIVLLAASPPAPEPMAEEQRDTMRSWFDDGVPTPEDAHNFVAANIARVLPDELTRQAEADVRRAGREAWLGWLERGSLEDWSAVVGVLETPALIVAGGEDGDLGADNQRRLNLPHYAHATIECVADAAHFLPLEQPDAVAALIAGHWKRVADRRILPLEIERLIRSDRTSARTRRALLDRLKPAGGPRLLSADQLNTLGAMIGRILPGCGDPCDLALRIDATLAAGVGDGWRFAELPADAEAWRNGLDTLVLLAADFAARPSAEQDCLLQRMADGQVGSEAGPGQLSSTQMKLWFEDVCAEAARTWLSQPTAMARIGYDGFANGGDGLRKQGYVRLAADDRESWQPAPVRTAG